MSILLLAAFLFLFFTVHVSELLTDFLFLFLDDELTPINEYFSVKVDKLIAIHR